jgi:RNA polymerase sigma factor (sigma-70 family)
MTWKRDTRWREATRVARHTDPSPGELTRPEGPPYQEGGPGSVAGPCVEVVGETVVDNSPAPTPRVALDRIAGGALRGQLVAEVARKFPHRAADDVEEALNEAYARGLTGCRWRRDREVYGWLRRTMVNWLIDSDRRERRELVVDTTAGAFLELADAQAEPLRVLGRRQDRRDVRDVHLTVLRQLGDRQRRVALLHGKGMERREIARRLAASENAVKKDLKRVFRVARDQVVVRSGHGCPDGEGLIVRYAFGLPGKAAAARAQLHLGGCARCRQFFKELEAWREKVAVLLPPSAAADADPGLLERALHKAVDALASLKQHASDSTTQAKQQLADAAGQAKQHAAAGYGRAVEYTPLAGARPGAAATAIAGCLALGGGAATYCIERGVDPFGAFGRDRPAAVAGAVQEPPDKKPPAERPPDPPQVPAAAPAPQPPAPEPTAPPAAPEPTAPAPQAPAPTPPAPPPPPPPPEPTPPAVQFGEPTNPAQSSPSTAAPSPQPTQPAPAPASGGDLYGP